LEGAGSFEDKFKFPLERQVAEGLIQSFVTGHFITFSSLAQPVKCLDAGDGIGDGVLPVEDDR